MHRCPSACSMYPKPTSSCSTQSRTCRSGSGASRRPPRWQPHPRARTQRPLSSEIVVPSSLFLSFPCFTVEVVRGPGLQRASEEGVHGGHPKQHGLASRRTWTHEPMLFCFSVPVGITLPHCTQGFLLMSGNGHPETCTSREGPHSLALV